MKIFYIICLILISTQSFGTQRSETFVVTILTNKVRVVSPKKFNNGMHAIIENKGLSKVYGKIETLNLGTLSHVAIPSGGSDSVVLKKKGADRIFFIPLSPANQEIELIAGQDSYEIPPKR